MFAKINGSYNSLKLFCWESETFMYLILTWGLMSLCYITNLWHFFLLMMIFDTLCFWLLQLLWTLCESDERNTFSSFMMSSCFRYTLSTSNSAIAALLCALYPHFPAHSTDNRWDQHLHTHICTHKTLL